MNVSITKNLEKFVVFYFILSIFFFIYQLILSNNSNDIICIFVLFISNLITLFYCFNKNYFYFFPISLLIIFFSHFVNLGSALFFKTLEHSVITKNLEYPLDTIIILSTINLSLIFGHYIYRHSKISLNLMEKIHNQLIRFKLINLESLKFVVIVSIIVIFMRVFIFDLNTSGIERGVGQEGFSIFQDITKGISFFIYMPLVIFFSKYLYNNESFKVNFKFLLFFLLSILFISFSSNTRSILLDNFVIVTIIVFILFIFNKIDLKKNLLKFLIILFLLIPTYNFLERVSSTFISERSLMIERTPIQNFFSFLSAITNDPSKIADLYKKQKYDFFFSENYYESTLFNRINVLLIHDNFIYIKKNITQNQKNEFINLQKNKIISIIPQPIINIFSKNFNKQNYRTSTASTFYKKYYEDFTSLAIGSSLISLYIIFNNWIYLFCLFVSIPIFIIFDSFYDKKNKIISPFILIFFYTTGYGVLKFFAATELASWIELTFRIIPQTILIFLFLRYFLNFIIKKVN